MIRPLTTSYCDLARFDYHPQCPDTFVGQWSFAPGGGRAKRLFQIEADGELALRASQDAVRKMSEDDVSDHHASRVATLLLGCVLPASNREAVAAENLVGRFVASRREPLDSMSTRFQVVLDVRGQGAAQSALIGDDHVIEARAASGANQALRVGVLPW